MPRKSSAFPSLTPSWRVTCQRYSEEWAWWEASGWRFLLEDKEDGSLLLHTLKKTGPRARLWSGLLASDKLIKPEEVRRFLVEALYLHLHPRQGRRELDTAGAVCTEAQLAAFIQQQRRLILRRRFIPS
ncbi:MAG: hypothetical protein ACRYG7_18185 [Janthinobacterium lividum]